MGDRICAISILAIIVIIIIVGVVLRFEGRLTGEATRPPIPAYARGPPGAMQLPLGAIGGGAGGGIQPGMVPQQMPTMLPSQGITPAQRQEMLRRQMEAMQRAMAIQQQRHAQAQQVVRRPRV